MIERGVGALPGSGDAVKIRAWGNLITRGREKREEKVWWGGEGSLLVSNIPVKPGGGEG